jgi:hypothetical protein
MYCCMMSVETTLHGGHSLVAEPFFVFFVLFLARALLELGSAQCMNSVRSSLPC